MAEKEAYKIVISKPAFQRYQREILFYLSRYFSEERARSINNSIIQKVQILSDFPELGSLEYNIFHESIKFRYILFNETRNLSMKIIYYVDTKKRSIIITNFFPVLMDPGKIERRNS